MAPEATVDATSLRTTGGLDQSITFSAGACDEVPDQGHSGYSRRPVAAPKPRPML